MKYLRKAQISRAAKVLEHADPAPKDEKTFQDLSDLHPQREFPYVDCAYPLCPRFLISVEQLSKAIHEAPSGSKPGLSNWTYEHLKALLSNDSKRKLQCLIDFADLILNDDNIPFS